jgi:hypothetical protein
VTQEDPLKQPKYTLSRRFVRRLGLTRNPVCRPVDRFEGILRTIVALALIAALSISTLVGLTAYARTSAAATHVRHQLHRTSVTLLEDVPNGAGDTTTSASPPHPGVQARWTQPDGSMRTGSVYTRELAHKGQRVMVWMNAFGDPVRPPVERGDLVVRAVLHGLAIASIACLALWMLYGLTRRHLNRRRDAAWTREWLLVAGGWRDHSL